MQSTISRPYQFQGNLFMPDITEELISNEFKGQLPQDFKLGDRDKLADEIAEAWAIAKVHWGIFQQALDRLPEAEAATTITRNKWVVPLLQRLGYDPVLTNAEIIDNQSYAISHRVEGGEHKPPLHIVDCRVGLETRPPSGKPRISAHGLMQEYLNRTEHLWGVVTNGYQWRLLRDSNLITRLTYVEFDLEQILKGENFAEFGLFYRLFHRSRLPEGMDDADKCLLEYYHQQTIQQGGRVRDKLRDGVEKAIELLANGLLQHPKNHELRSQCATGEIKATEFYRQLLKLIYRLLFLMVAEARDLLLTDSTQEQRKIYLDYYSVDRLRRMSERPLFAREGYNDLWCGLLVTFKLLDENWRGKALGISPLNGDLFGSTALNYIEKYAIDNYDLLLAIRCLSTYEHQEKNGKNRQIRRVNYEALNVEEFGSIYESLLDFYPQIEMISGSNCGSPLIKGGWGESSSQLSIDNDSMPSGSGEGGDPPKSPLTRGTLNGSGSHLIKWDSFRSFSFQLVKGSDRKSTGSYYTPPELVTQLIKTALEPVIAEKLKNADTQVEKERALLSITVCDPACGSGHFLLAAARRIGKELARVRTGEYQPGLEHLRPAMRDAIGHCIYGVDLNPLAVDLCKVALWIEGHTSGYPLSFLDHRIKCGNSLVGVLDLGCLAEGIPEGAFKDVTGDDKSLATKLKKRNKEEIKTKGQLNIFDNPQLQAARDRYTQTASEIGTIPEVTTTDVRTKQERYQNSRRDANWYRDYTICNLWTAAFFTPLTAENLQLIPTTETMQRLMLDPHAMLSGSGVDLDPPSPLGKGEPEALKVPLIKGDLGGSHLQLSTDNHATSSGSGVDLDPPSPLGKGEPEAVKVPLFKGDLGGSSLQLSTDNYSTPSGSGEGGDPPQPPFKRGEPEAVGGSLPLYEAKMLHQFDHRWATYHGDNVRDVELAEKQNPDYQVTPRYWVDKAEVDKKLAGKWDKQWLLAFRDICRATDERTAIVSLLPRVGVGNKAPLLLPKAASSAKQVSVLLGNVNSLVFDFVTRQKIGGTSLNFFIVKQLPVLPPTAYTPTDIEFISSRVLELVYTSWEMQPFAQDMGYNGAPFIWNETRRALLRAELDAKYAKLYGLTHDELRYILDPSDVYGAEFPSETFRVLKNKEMKEYGEYRTQRLVLAAWDLLESGGQMLSKVRNIEDFEMISVPSGDLEIRSV